MPARIVAATRRTRASRTNCHPPLPMICAEQASRLPVACGSAWQPIGFQLRSILMSLVNPHALHASVRSSNLPPNRSGLTRATTISVPHSGHVDEGGSGGVSRLAT